MGWNRGTLHQKFKIEIDIEPLLENITNKVLEKISEDREIDYVECDEFYAEDYAKLVIDGAYDAVFRSMYSKATYWNPAEYDEERPRISDADPKWMLDNISDELKKFIKISSVTEDDDLCERKYSDEED